MIIEQIRFGFLFSITLALLGENVEEKILLSAVLAMMKYGLVNKQP